MLAGGQREREREGTHGGIYSERRREQRWREESASEGEVRAKKEVKFRENRGRDISCFRAGR